MIFVAVLFACFSGQCQFVADDQPPHQRASACEARLADMHAQVVEALPGARVHGSCIPVPVLGV